MDYTTHYFLNKPAYTDDADITILNANADTIDTQLYSKVNKVTGKGLSTNDYTTLEKIKLSDMYDYIDFTYTIGNWIIRQYISGYHILELPETTMNIIYNNSYKSNTLQIPLPTSITTLYTYQVTGSDTGWGSWAEYWYESGSLYVTIVRDTTTAVSLTTTARINIRVTCTAPGSVG